MAKKWRLPPRSFWRLEKNKNRLVQDCLREYYALHPEHAPAPGWKAALSLHQARLGYPDHLIARFRAKDSLSDDEINFIVMALEATRRKRYSNVKLRELQQVRIGDYFESLRREGIKPKSAQFRAMDLFNCSKRDFYRALNVYKKSRGRVTL